MGSSEKVQKTHQHIWLLLNQMAVAAFAQFCQKPTKALKDTNDFENPINKTENFTSNKVQLYIMLRHTDSTDIVPAQVY